MVFFMVKKNHLWRQVAGSPIHGARFQFRQCCCSSEVCLEFTVFRFRASNFDVVVYVYMYILFIYIYIYSYSLKFTVFRFRASNFDVVVVVGVQCLPLVSGN